MLLTTTVEGSGKEEGGEKEGEGRRAIKEWRGKERGRERVKHTGLFHEDFKAAGRHWCRADSAR